MNRPSSFSWRPATTFVLIAGIVVLLVGLAVSYGVSTFKPTTQLRIGGGVYSLWIADTEAEREQGLSGVLRLNPGGGMLFKFDTSDTWGIWMKGMKIPIDIVWLNSNKEVVYIVKNANPESGISETYTPRDPARYVVELAAGAVDKAGIRQGMTAEFDEADPGKLW